MIKKELPLRWKTQGLGRWSKNASKSRINAKSPFARTKRKKITFRIFQQHVACYVSVHTSSATDWQNVKPQTFVVRCGYRSCSGRRFNELNRHERTTLVGHRSFNDQSFKGR